MKEDIIRKAQNRKGIEGKLNGLREELHHLMLQEIDRKGAFDHICFVGGTALRLIYGLNRFSEDLNFSMGYESRGLFGLAKLARDLTRCLNAFGLDCDITRLTVKRNVQSCFFNFSNLLSALDRSFQAGQKLSIKFEIDANPPEGARDLVTPVVSSRLYQVRHYDLPSLFAGKLHAILYRAYTKGRDLYDFLWYTGQKIKVNRRLLENAIFQTQKETISLTNEKLQMLLEKKFEKTDFEKARKDAAPFLTDSGEIALFKAELFTNSVKFVTLLND